jgi:addiction module HigA family antidote
VLKELCLDPLNLTITATARALGVSRKTLSGILNGRAEFSPEMAVRLSIAFNTSAESWLNQQLQYDLWHAEKTRKRLHVAKLSRLNGKYLPVDRCRVFIVESERTAGGPHAFH